MTERLAAILNAEKGGRIASMGYPDIVAPPELIAKVLGDRLENLKYREDSEAICKWHGIKPVRPIPDAKSFFSLLGADLEVFDIVQTRGDEIMRDLNYPIDERDEYDFVLDVGTIEHCFNIGQAALNMAGLLKPSGLIFHGNPFNSGNHGFYGLNPTWYADFYGQPGFELMHCHLEARGSTEQYTPALTGRFSCPYGEVNIFAIARRIDVRPIRFPVQHKYAKMIGAVNG